MATPQLSPGVLVREVDLTVGRAENVLDNIGAIAGPFPIGPVNEPITIETQQQFLDTFGKPMSTDRQYEYWMSANSFLSYGGILKVVRTDGAQLNNSNAGVNQASGTLKIENSDDYELNHENSSGYYWAGRNPGSWANSMKVCVIDDQADQIVSVATTNPGALEFKVGLAVTAVRNSITIPGDGETSLFTGSLKGIITGVNTDAVNGNSTLDLKVVSRLAPDVQSFTGIGTTTVSVEASPNDTVIFLQDVSGITTGNVLVTGNGNDKAIITGFGTTSVTVQFGIGNTVTVGTAVTFEDMTTTTGGETPVTYQNFNAAASFQSGDVLRIRNSVGVRTGDSLPSIISVKDWYDDQTLNLDNSVVFWKSIAAKPVSSQYALSRDGGGDGIHVAVIDDTGEVTGIQGAVLEKFTNLSKASDATADGDSPKNIYYKEFVANNSNFVFAGYSPANAADSFWGTAPVATGFSTGYTANTIS